MIITKLRQTALKKKKVEKYDCFKFKLADEESKTVDV